jgi:hypothetical protein
MALETGYEVFGHDANAQEIEAARETWAARDESFAQLSDFEQEMNARDRSCPFAHCPLPPANFPIPFPLQCCGNVVVFPTIFFTLLYSCCGVKSKCHFSAV